MRKRRSAPESELKLRSIVGVTLLVVVALLATPAVAAAPRTFYLSLGDSLAVGTQPDSHGKNHETRQGYVDVLGQRIAATAAPELGLVKLGCSGERTTTMLKGAGCRHRGVSQLVEAEQFLLGHQGSVALVTVGIGDNDVERCFHSDGSLDRPCLTAGIGDIRANLPAVVARLRAAAGPNVPIAGVTDYDQFLALWLKGTSGQSAARRSIRLVTYLNQIVDSIYRKAGIVVADAASRFATTDLGHQVPLAGHGRVPQAVSHICRLTWACSPDPIGLNDHANAAGYRVIADTVETALRRVAPRLFSPVLARSTHGKRASRRH